MGSTYWDIGGHSLEVAEWRLRSTLGEESTPPFGFPLERPKTVSGSARFCVSVEGHRISSPPCTPAGGAISGRCIFSKDSPAPFCFAKLAKCRRPICCSGRNGRLVGDGFRRAPLTSAPSLRCAPSSSPPRRSYFVRNKNEFRFLFPTFSRSYLE